MKKILPKLIDSFADRRGVLYVIDNLSQLIPFTPKRLYFIKAPISSKRGQHSHKTLEQFFILIEGKAEMKISKHGEEDSVIEFSIPGHFFYLASGYYREIIFSHNTILLVLASLEYDELDYLK